MKKFFLSLFLSLFALSAYSVDLRQLFIDMPDSIMPLLNKNNKLDFLDYLDMDMPAVADCVDRLRRARIPGTSLREGAVYAPSRV